MSTLGLALTRSTCVDWWNWESCFKSPSSIFPPMTTSEQPDRQRNIAASQGHALAASKSRNPPSKDCSLRRIGSIGWSLLSYGGARRPLAFAASRSMNRAFEGTKDGNSQEQTDDRAEGID